MRTFVRQPVSFTGMVVLLGGLIRLAGPVSAQAQRPLGTDVSHYQGTGINWSNVKAAGVSFAWCKATESTTFTDNTFALNQTNARAAGVLVGAYHFARPSRHPNITGTNSAVSEAAYFWGVVSNYVKPGGTYLVPMLDWEDTGATNQLSTATMSAWVNQWCTTVSNYALASGAGSLKPIVYTGVWYSKPSSTYSGLNSSVTNWPDWIAAYPSNPDPQTGGPSSSYPWSTWRVWQYADTNWSGGDSDVFNGTAAQLMATLVISPGPVITSQPQSLAVDVGHDAGFSVAATGLGAVTYQWRFNGADIPGATDSAFTRTSAQLADEGSYSVALTDTNATVLSSNAMLTVIMPPVITVQPQDQVVAVGQNATFSVGAAGQAPLSYQWQFEGNALAGATGTALVVAAQAASAGAYAVVVSNEAGSVTSSNAALVLVQNAIAGDNSFGQGVPFAGTTNLIAVAAGAWHNLGLRADGTVVAWGDNSSGQCNVPASVQGALAIAAGGYHSLAIRLNGTVVAWGADDYGQTDVPAGLSGVIGVAAGTWHSVALRANGTVAAWGDNTFGQCTIPPGLSNVTAVAAGGNHTLALKADGTVVAWGENTSAEGLVTGQSTVPIGLANVAAIGAGDYHSLAVKKDGTVVAWGDNSQGQLMVPIALKNAVAVAGGGAHSVALGADGAVTAWGSDWNGQCDAPPGMAAASGVAAGEEHTLVLLADSIPVPDLLSPTLKKGNFSTLIQTLSRKSYALERTDILGGTNWTPVCTNAGNGGLRILSDLTAGAPRRFYRMRQW